jgi:SAM-dependent methyltransferase
VLTSDVFDAYGRYYDLLYRDKDYAAETDYIVRLLQAHLDGRDLLEFGSGTGRHGRLLAERGYRVMGVERSAEMIARAERTPGFSCIQGDICEVQLDRKFDAVLSLFHVVSYQTSNASVCAVFDRAAVHLAPGGVFIFDVWYTPAVHTQLPATRVRRLSDERVDIVRIAEPHVYPNENRVDVHYTIIAKDRASGLAQEVREIHPMRHFSLPELDLLAEQSGFERVAVEGFLSGGPPSEDSWGVCVVMRKK